MSATPAPAPDRPATDLDALHQRVWAELVRACADRHHEWRLPVLASVDGQGLPQARTVVLRQADAAAGELAWNTDRRSPKAAQLRARPDAVLVFWSRRLSWQLRATLRVEVLDTGPRVEAAWQRVAAGRTAHDYLAADPPGTVLASGNPAPLADPAAAHHLAVLVGRVQALDWLELHREEGPRRARLAPAGAGCWLVP